MYFLDRNIVQIKQKLPAGWTGGSFSWQNILLQAGRGLPSSYLFRFLMAITVRIASRAAGANRAAMETALG